MPTPERAVVDIEVCYALPETQTLIHLSVPAGTTLRDAIRASGIRDAHPTMDPDTQRIGVFGKLRDPADKVSDGDRVEIYRPLRVDPKVARQRRVNKARSGGSVEGRKWQSRDSR
jgi:putative ubiquitin-RnfH superfamily antitoxin RatB of RatAB toxin-antitoxin module